MTSRGAAHPWHSSRPHTPAQSTVAVTRWGQRQLEGGGAWQLLRSVGGSHGAGEFEPDWTGLVGGVSSLMKRESPSWSLVVIVGIYQGLKGCLKIASVHLLRRKNDIRKLLQCTFDIFFFCTALLFDKQPLFCYVPLKARVFIDFR